jgi:hypothetical protein
MEADAELNGWNYFNYFTEIEEHFPDDRALDYSFFACRLGADRNLEERREFPS